MAFHIKRMIISIPFISQKVFLFGTQNYLHPTPRKKKKKNKSGVKRLNTLGHLDQYMAQHGLIVKQSYCETVLVTILFNSN